MVALYVWSLAPDAPEYARFDSLLNPEESARRDRFVFARDRNAFVMARGGLRDILGHETGQDPAMLQFIYGSHGKPMLENGPQFNLSHSGGIACLAVHETCEIGVDIEAIRPIERDIAPRFFSAAENADLNARPDAEQQDAFFRCWTRKEAIIKGLGGGLSIPLKDFDVSLDVDGPALLRLDPAYGAAADWAMVSFRCGQTICGALAAKTTDPTLKVKIKRSPKDCMVIVSGVSG